MNRLGTGVDTTAEISVFVLAQRDGGRDQEQTEEEAGQVGGASDVGRGLQPMVEVTEDVMEEYQCDMDEDFQVKIRAIP